MEDIATVLEEFKISSSPRIPRRSSSLPDDLPYPLNPKPLLSRSRKDVFHVKAVRGTRSHQPTPSPDRFIPTRRISPDTSSRSFHVSKNPERLSSMERLLRQSATNSDPFITRRVVSNPVPRRIAPRAPMNGSTLSSQHRSVSAGAVWNVGGATPAPSGPMVGVVDGRGGLLGSGTNAPMFSSDFFRKESADQSLERYESRLAAALKIDQASRILDFSTTHEPEESNSGHNLRLSSLESWQNKAWLDGGNLYRKRKATIQPGSLDEIWNCDMADSSLAPAPKPKKSRAVPTTPFRYVGSRSVRSYTDDWIQFLTRRDFETTSTVPSWLTVTPHIVLPWVYRIVSTYGQRHRALRTHDVRSMKPYVAPTLHL